MYPALALKLAAPLVALAITGLMAITPPPAPPPMEVQVIEARQAAKGVAIKGKVIEKKQNTKDAPELEFDAIIDTLTHQPGQLTRITIRGHNGQVTAEYWHPTPAAPPSEVANSPTDMQALRTVYRWYRSQPKTGEWLRSLIGRGKTGEHTPDR